MLLNITKSNNIISFEKTPLIFIRKNIISIFCKKNNSTLRETLEKPKYTSLKPIFQDLFKNKSEKLLGDFLEELKKEGDERYLMFLNKYGDSSFCEFKIKEHLSDKGIYCWVYNNEIKYVGRCVDNFKKRINQGYGKICPKNCFKDGQATNCHINSLINKTEGIELYIYKMTSSSRQTIEQLERDILLENNFDWNIQKK